MYGARFAGIDLTSDAAGKEVAGTTWPQVLAPVGMPYGPIETW